MTGVTHYQLVEHLKLELTLSLDRLLRQLYDAFRTPVTVSKCNFFDDLKNQAALALITDSIDV